MDLYKMAVKLSVYMSIEASVSLLKLFVSFIFYI